MITNEDILAAFINKEVFADMTEVVEFMLDANDYGYVAPIDVDMIENGNSDDRIKKLEKEIEDMSAEEPYGIYSDEWTEWYNKVSELEDELAMLSSFEDDKKVSWYAVTDWLGRQLFLHGEQVIDSYDYYFWAIPCTERPIDRAVITDIANEAEILLGQKDDWSKYL